MAETSRPSPRWPQCLLILGLGLGPGCTGDPAQPEDARVEQTTGEGVIGTWQIVLSPEERHQRKVLELALRTPRASSDELDRSELTIEERMMVEMIAMAKAQDPSDSKVQQMQAMLNDMAQTTLSVTTNTLTLSVGERHVVRTYTIVSNSGPTLEVHATDPAGDEIRASLTLIESDTLDYQESGQSRAMRFIRQP